MSKFEEVQKLQSEIDLKKAQSQEKQKSHHLTYITGIQETVEYVVCTDGTEIPYTKSEEQKLNKVRLAGLEE